MFEAVRLEETGGTFKYIQITVTDAESQEEVILVRGWRSCQYHQDILSLFRRNEVNNHPKKGNRRLKTSSPGGGRIEYDIESKKITCFGYSNSFGQADHEMSTEIIKKSFPDFTVEWNNDGY